MKTKSKTVAGPTVDTAFFKDLGEVFDRYPEEARKYAVRDISLETEVLHIDFAKQKAVSNIEGNKIITMFVDRDEKVQSVHHACCDWIRSTGWSCIHQCEK
ncbi:hypothetical protein [Rhizocola hellebori]|uniref:hypothetical protein n=1 Tax=Rhizocola hellebori TaxID=1392758 RepID=UPI001942434F|nr:hypothetical protein [Rhizocola hellebori]